MGPRRSPAGSGPRVIALILIAPAVLDLAVPGGAAAPSPTTRCETDTPSEGDAGDDDPCDDLEVRDLLAGAERQALALEIQGRDLESFYVTHVDPLVRDLVRLRSDEAHVRRIAVALVREGMAADVDPRLLLAVVRVENPWLEPGALSPAGAVGLMQVMPFHAGAWGCESEDLTDPETNVCHGTRILAHALRRLDGDLERALLRYNGCVRGTNTPDCHSYPSRVLAHAASWAASAGSRQVVASVRAR